MALKLGKCRLCLKLGDFYSIFTVDNTMQLAEMVMDCTRVKIYEGDGLPDKICSECIQKLSSAYIFKQQCERSDEELRRNYVPPPGFSVSPPPPNRQSSDSAFSNHTNISHQTKPPSSNESKATPASRKRKRSGESLDNASVNSYIRPSSSKRVEELRSSRKRQRMNSENTSLADSDYEDNSINQFSVETDSDEPLIAPENKCKICNKEFKSVKSVSAHMRVHYNKDGMGKDAVVDIPKNNIQDATDVEDKLSCDKCGKTFKLKIMLKRHSDVCGIKSQVSPQKELLISLEPIDKTVASTTRLPCEMCTTTFKNFENLQKHMRICHASVLDKEKFEKNNPSAIEPRAEKVCVPCFFCGKPFDDYYVHAAHYAACPEKRETPSIECTVCGKVVTRKHNYFKHIKDVHFNGPPAGGADGAGGAVGGARGAFECRMCRKQLPSQEQLITHLAAHVSNIEADTGDTLEDESRASTQEDSVSVNSEYSANVPSGPLSCKHCDKRFTYKKSLESHVVLKHSQTEVAVKTEPPDKKPAASASDAYPYADTDSDSSQDGDDNTCDICEKQFSYKRLLLHHKRTKHNMSSGTKRAKILLKDCSVKCLICDLDMKVSAINEHNQKHTAVNMKPRNLYTCVDCEEKFKSCSALANHIKLVHRLKQQTPKRLVEGADLADFCEVVVTKTEPLDSVQSHNDFGAVPGSHEVPLVNMSGFTCPICSKQMNTLISLKRHVNWHTNVGNNIQKQIECFVCNETFRFQCHYKLHMREHYHDTQLDPKHLTCPICNRRSKHLRAARAHMNFHKQTRFKNKDYQCSICKRVFQHRKVYLTHMAVHYKKGDTVANTIVGDALPHTADRAVYDGTHTCGYCGKVCDSDNSLKCHVAWHKSKSSLYGARHECHICGLQFTNKKRQELHIRTHYEDDNGPYKCNICGKGYIDEEYFRRHVKGHNFDHQSHKKRIERLRKDKIKCPICSRFYPDLVKLIRHLKRTHPESKMIKQDPDAPPPSYFSCKLCARVFLDERRLQMHEESHLRKPEVIKCKLCGLKSKSMKKHRIHIKTRHLTQKHLDDPMKCPNCEETFIKTYELHHHLRDAHGINETWIAERTEQTLDGPLRELQCSICLKVLASKGNYERHLDFHNSLRCNYCFEYFNTLRFLEGHLQFSCEKKMLIGDTEVYPKKIKCHVCYKAFHLQVKLDCHLHTQHGIRSSKEASLGKRDIVCDYCFRVFENEYALSTHKIYHRTVGYYGCIYCNRKFNTLTLYKKHKNHHFAQLNVDNPTKCEHCDQTFVAFREMIYHMRDEHADDKEWIVLPKDSIEEECNICHKKFFNLHRHLSYHEENRCKKCGEYFYSQADYDNHLCAIESDEEVGSTELDVRPKYEECRFCFKPITRKNSRQLHDNLHRVSGAISCRFCTHKFKTMDAFNIHAFSHRSRKYTKKPLKCRVCKEKFVKYGPFMRHMRAAHKAKQKLHYRAVVKPEPCAVCGDSFPNLHNHYRAHLQNQCQLCRKYFTSVKCFTAHRCDKDDEDPSKVFTSDANLSELINAYVPKDLKDDEKYYGYTDDEEEEEVEKEGKVEEYNTPTFQLLRGNESQNSVEQLIQSPVISDVLSLYQKPEETQRNGDGDGDSVVCLTDDDSVDLNVTCPTITIDD